jgi:FkbM family methyltransferase
VNDSGEDAQRRALEATGEARALTPGADIEVLWRGMWVRRVGADYFPDPEYFSRPDAEWPKWMARRAKYLRDAEDYWFHVYRPRSGDVVVDIGAGRGEDVFAFSRAAGPAGRVWAIEPHPVSYRALCVLTELNGLANVTAVNRACTESPADLRIETLPVWESNYVRTGAPSPNSHPVRGVPFDEIAAEHGIGRVDFLKMNIEGAERGALPGCRETLARTRSVCVAAHDFRAARGEGEHFRTLSFVRDFLAAAGFRLITRDDDRRYYVPYHVHGVRG